MPTWEILLSPGWNLLFGSYSRKCHRDFVASLNRGPDRPGHSGAPFVGRIMVSGHETLDLGLFPALDGARGGRFKPGNSEPKDLTFAHSDRRRGTLPPAYFLVGRVPHTSELRVGIFCFQ